MKDYEAVAYLDQESADKLIEFLDYSGITNHDTSVTEAGDIAVLVKSSDYEKAFNLYNAFCENEDENSDYDEAANADASSDSESDTDENADGTEKVTDTKVSKDQDEDNVPNLYESSEEKYKDNLSSAITFLICGAIGIIIMVLNDIGVIKLVSKDSSSFILTNVVLILLFIVFLGIGIWSLVYSKRLKKDVSKEDMAVAEAIDFLKKNVTEVDIESSYNTDIADEMKYFSRAEYVKKALKDKYPELEDGLIDTIADNYLEEVFNS